MRKYLFIFFFLSTFFIQRSTAQYIPVLNDSMTWDTWLHDYSLLACSGVSGIRAFISGDTLIGSNYYKIISEYQSVELTPPLPCPIWALDNTSEFVVAYLREDTTLQKVWSYDTINGTEKLLFDFSLQPGDSLVVDMNGALWVDSIAALQFPDGTIRRKFYLSSPIFGIGYGNLFMIEGIGGSSGVYYTPGMIGIGFEYLLHCVFKNNIQLVPDPLTTFWSCPGLIGDYNLISGNIFYDWNSNLIQDVGEISAHNLMVTETVTNTLNFTDLNGDYNIYIPDTGNLTVSPSAIANYSSTPVSHSAYFNGLNQIDSLNNFAIQPVSIFNDLKVTLLNGVFRPGFSYNRYTLNVQNIGTALLGGTLHLYKDSGLTYVSSTQTPDFISNDSISWIIPPMYPFETVNISARFSIDSLTPIGTPFLADTRIDPIAGDINSVNNFDTTLVFASAAFDPNDITVDQDTIFTTQLINPPFLEYLIRFQNTGNDTAFTVRIENVITPLLNANSFEFISASHPVSVTWDQALGRMTYTFNNILLPDSNVNETASHGYINYKIKPLSTLPAGFNIMNNALIYFDFNAAISTNTAYTQILLPTGVNEVYSSLALLVYPNPVSEIVTLYSDEFENKNIHWSIYDLTGRITDSRFVNNSEKLININLSHLTRGIYFVKVDIDGKSRYNKIMKL